MLRKLVVWVIVLICLVFVLVGNTRSSRAMNAVSFPTSLPTSTRQKRSSRVSECSKDCMTTGPGGYWRADKEFVDPSCSRRPLRSMDAAEMLRGQRWLWMGTSHLRYLMKQVALLAHNNASINRHNTSQLHFPHIQAEFIWVWADVTKPFNLPTSIENQTFDRVLTSHGFWHMLYRDTPDYIDVLHRDLGYLRRHFPNVSITVLNLHRVHDANPLHWEGKLPPRWVLPQRHCASSKRVERFRDVIRCVALRTPDTNLLDVYTLTNTSVAKLWARADGHHYKLWSPVMLEVARVLLHGEGNRTVMSPSCQKECREVEASFPTTHDSLCTCVAVQRSSGNQHGVNCVERDKGLKAFGRGHGRLLYADWLASHGKPPPPPPPPDPLPLLE